MLSTAEGSNKNISHKLEEELKSFLSDVLEKAEVFIPNAAHGALGSVLKDLFVTVQQVGFIYNYNGRRNSNQSAQYTVT